MSVEQLDLFAPPRVDADWQRFEEPTALRENCVFERRVMHGYLLDVIVLSDVRSPEPDPRRPGGMFVYPSHTWNCRWADGGCGGGARTLSDARRQAVEAADTAAARKSPSCSGKSRKNWLFGRTA